MVMKILLVGADMLKLKLTGKLLTGNEKIDAQHLMMFKWANKILSNQQWEPKLLVKVINFLLGYIQYHFKAEQRFMIEMAFPNYEQHKKLHKILIEQVKDIRLAIMVEEPRNSLMARIHNVFDQWYGYHFSEIDKQMIEYIRSMSDMDEARLLAAHRLIKEGELGKRFKNIEKEAKEHLDSNDKKLWLNLPDL
jgi:hemerythrin